MPNQLKKPTRQPRQKTTQTQPLLSLGSIISWDFHGRSWTPETLRNLAKQSNLNIAIPDIPVNHGVNTAIASWKRKSANGTLTAKKTNCDNQVVSIAILETVIDSNQKRAKGDTIDKVVYDSKSKSFISKGTSNHAKSLCEAIQHKVTHYQGNEFRKWLIMPFVNQLNPIKISRGCYFISFQHSQEIDALYAFCKSSGVTLEVLDQVPNDRTKETVANKEINNLSDPIEKIKEDLRKYKIRSSVRADGRETVSKKIGRLKDRSLWLKETLEANVDELNQTIEDLEKELEELENQQPTGKKTSDRVTQAWTNAMCEKYELKKDGKVTGYRIPFSDFDQLLLPLKTAKNKFYWKPTERLGIVLESLGYRGQVLATALLLKPLPKT